MALQIGGGGSNDSLLSVDPSHKAARVNLRPAQMSGSFLLNIAGTTAAAPGASGILFAFRWGSSTKFALIRRLRLELMVTTASTAGVPEMVAYIGRSWTASDSGGTQVSMAGSNQKRRSSLQSSDIASSGDIRFANGGVLTAGTRTLDSMPIISAMAPLAVSGAPIAMEFGGAMEDTPIVLTQSEGIEVQNLTALTSCIYRYHVQMEWDETLYADWST